MDVEAEPDFELSFEDVEELAVVEGALGAGLALSPFMLNSLGPESFSAH